MEYTFTNSFQSDDQIINESTYTLSLDINTLLDNSQTNRRAERFQRGELSRPPKCQNAFILYRKDKMASLEFKNRKPKNKIAGNVSKEIKNLWDSEPEYVKLFFRALARKAKQRHSENYERRTENELETEEQVYSIDQTFIEQSQHSFNYLHTQCLLFADPTPPNLISHNQNTMSDANYLASYTHEDSTSSNLSSQNLNLIENPNLTDYPSDTQQPYYLVDHNTYTLLCHSHLQLSLILSEYP
jgi:hypothetical protein